jgi:hypothetical protein
VSSQARYIDFSSGGTSGSVRFESNAARTTCLEALQAGTLTVLVGGAEAVWAIIEGDEEKEYWKGAFAAMKVSRGPPLGPSGLIFGSFEPFV